MNSKVFRIIILMLVDAIIVAFSSIMPLALRFGIFTMDIAYLEPAIKCLPADIVITIGVLAAFKLYNRVSVSYTHLDVYKRQAQTCHDTPRYIRLHREIYRHTDRALCR